MYYTRNILLLYYNFLHFTVFTLTIDNFPQIYNLPILVTFTSSFFIKFSQYQKRCFLKEQRAFFQLGDKNLRVHFDGSASWSFIIRCLTPRFLHKTQPPDFQYPCTHVTSSRFGSRYRPDRYPSWILDTIRRQNTSFISFHFTFHAAKNDGHERQSGIR